MKATSAFFIGHKDLPDDRVAQIIKRLDSVIEALTRRGVTHFISGGAVGFDQIAASLVLEKKRLCRPVRLTLVLPSRERDDRLTELQMRNHRRLLVGADEVVYLSERSSEGCIAKRNRYMADRSSWCIAALLQNAGRTWETVQYARENGVRIINTAQTEAETVRIDMSSVLGYNNV